MHSYPHKTVFPTKLTKIMQDNAQINITTGIKWINIFLRYSMQSTTTLQMNTSGIRIVKLPVWALKMHNNGNITNITFFQSLWGSC